MQISKSLGVVVTAWMVLGISLAASADRDKKGDRIHVKDDTIYRGSSAKQLLAVEQIGLCDPDLRDEDLVTTFTGVSRVGGTALAFDLAGFNGDGTEIDSAYVDAAMRIKDASNYRWMPTVMRVLGSLEHADAATRMNAVETAARTFRNTWSILYWIDGPYSKELVETFRAVAPKLAVLAPWNGDVLLVVHPDHAVAGRPTVLLGAIPEGHTHHALLPDAEHSYAALEAYNRETIELLPLYPSSVGLAWHERIEGWTMLYNGRTLEGWTVTGRRKDGFVSEDGVIQWKRRGGSSLQTRERYGDFMLRLEWKLLRAGANSGLFLRAPRANRESKMGFEFQMLGDYGEAPHKNGTGSVYDVLAPTENASRPVGEWNELEIYLNGPHYRATLNGVVVQDVNFDEYDELRNRLREGFIALQDHGSEVRFRNIRVKKL